MACGDGQGTPANSIVNVAKHFGLFRWVVGDLPIVLRILGVTIQNHAFDLSLRSSVEGGHGAGHEGGALATIGHGM